jgi:tRNA threonylcarbamoyladenosine biosynthesis protein TsaE
VTIDHPPIIRTVEWPDEAACAAFAGRLSREAGLRDAFVTLQGPLGAGKTTFARHLLRALGVSGRIKSPTYAVVEPHQGRDFPVWHFDFYRFTDPREWEDAGFRDLFGQPGLKLAEWPEQAAALLPRADLALTIEPLDDTRRRVRVDARSALGQRLGDAAAGPGEAAA